MFATDGPLASDGVDPVVDHHQAVVLPGLPHTAQLPPPEDRQTDRWMKRRMTNNCNKSIPSISTESSAKIPSFAWRDSLLRAGVVNLAVAEDSAGHVVAHRTAADVDEAVGLHRAVAAASHQHFGLHLPRLRPGVVALKQVQSGAAWRDTQGK